jgi:hypothetical protein
VEKISLVINISTDFYQETKTIFHEQKKLSIQAQNVHTGRTISINNSISFPKENSFQNKTITEIAKSGVEFFISDRILELDLKNLNNQCGLTYSDLEFISRKIGWQNPELQYSIDNFALALETKTFIATKLSPREAFISILTGNGKREPRLFNKPQELIKIEATRIKEQSIQETVNLEEAKQYQEEIQIQAVKENYWFSISDEKKQEYLKESRNDLHGAIELANSRVCTDHDEFSLSKILKSLDAPELPQIKIQNIQNDNDLGKIEGQAMGHVQFFPSKLINSRDQSWSIPVAVYDNSACTGSQLQGNKLYDKLYHIRSEPRTKDQINKVDAMPEMINHDQEKICYYEIDNHKIAIHRTQL